MHEKIVEHFNRSDAAGNSVVARGRVLEDLVECIFQEIDGISLYRKNHFNAGRSAEYDLSFVNQYGLYLLAGLFLVECKNTRTRTSAAQIRNFQTKIRQAGLTQGILVTSQGVTGDPVARTAAWDAILRAKGELVWIVPITRSDLEAVANADDLAKLITDRHLELFGYG